MSSAIIGMTADIPRNEKSHVRGWAKLWAMRVGDAEIIHKDGSLDGYNKIYLDHGVNHAGPAAPVSAFGGVFVPIYERFRMILDAHDRGAQIISLDHPFDKFHYGQKLAARLEPGGPWTGLDRFDLMKVQTLTMGDLDTTHAIIGDSHAGAYSLSDQQIRRVNGTTLHSALKNSLTTWLRPFLEGQEYDQVEICLGSIDARHHAIRLGMDPEVMALDYCGQMFDAEESLGIKIKACAPVPVEHEDRRIPGTGRYKGENFYGTRDERLAWTLAFKSRLESSWPTVSPPEAWYALAGEDWAKKHMEISSSVHIAPPSYRSVHGWDHWPSETSNERRTIQMNWERNDE